MTEDDDVVKWIPLDEHTKEQVACILGLVGDVRQQEEARKFIGDSIRILPSKEFELHTHIFPKEKEKCSLEGKITELRATTNG